MSARDELPTAIGEVGELKIGSVTLRTYVLDNGQRIINADDFHALLEAWGNGDSFSEEEATKVARFMRGLD